jgi:hypothetical protein
MEHYLTCARSQCYTPLVFISTLQMSKVRIRAESHCVLTTELPMLVAALNSRDPLPSQACVDLPPRQGHQGETGHKIEPVRHATLSLATLHCASPVIGAVCTDGHEVTQWEEGWVGEGSPATQDEPRAVALRTSPCRHHTHTMEATAVTFSTSISRVILIPSRWHPVGVQGHHRSLPHGNHAVHAGCSRPFSYQTQIIPGSFPLLPFLCPRVPDGSRTASPLAPGSQMSWNRSWHQ